MPQTSDVASRTFIAPGASDAPTCRRVQAAMDAGTPEQAEVLGDGFELQEDVRRATQIDIADTVLAMVDADARRRADTHRVVLQADPAVARGRELSALRDRRLLQDRTSIARTCPSWPLTERRQITIVLFLESSREAEPSGGFDGGVLRLFPDEGDPIDIAAEGRHARGVSRAAMPHEVTRVTAGRRDADRGLVLLSHFLQVRDVYESMHPRRKDDPHDANEDDAAEKRVDRGEQLPRRNHPSSTGPIPLRIIDAFRNASSQPRCPAMW